MMILKNWNQINSMFFFFICSKNSNAKNHSFLNNNYLTLIKMPTRFVYTNKKIRIQSYYFLIWNNFNTKIGKNIK